MKLTPKCNAHQMLKVIRRSSCMAADDLKPEHKLIFAIIGNAISDLLSKQYRPSAIYFFNQGGFEIDCDLVGLDAPYVKRLLNQGGFLI